MTLEILVSTQSQSILLSYAKKQSKDKKHPDKKEDEHG